MLVTLSRGPRSRPQEYAKTLRERLPRAFPGTSFAFLPADIVTQILNFGSACADRRAGRRHRTSQANRDYADKLLTRIKQVPGVADARIQQAFNAPTLNVDVDRTRAALVGVSERDVAENLQDALAGSIQTAPTFWLNPKNGVSYPIVAQTPQYWDDSLSSLRTSRLRCGSGADPRRRRLDQALRQPMRSCRTTPCSR